MYYTAPKNKKIHNCENCPKDQRKIRRCDDKGFNNLEKPRRVDEYGVLLNFCPAKATWYNEIAETFEQCRIACETGIMPLEGSFLDQPSMFVETFPVFVERWKYRRYLSIWQDVIEYTPKVLEAIARMFGGGKKKGAK